MKSNKKSRVLQESANQFGEFDRIEIPNLSTTDCDCFMLEIPKNFDIRKLRNQVINLETNAELQINDEKYVFEPLNDSNERAVFVATSKKLEKLDIQNVLRLNECKTTAKPALLEEETDEIENDSCHAASVSKEAHTRNSMGGKNDQEMNHSSQNVLTEAIRDQQFKENQKNMTDSEQNVHIIENLELTNKQMHNDMVTIDLTYSSESSNNTSEEHSTTTDVSSDDELFVIKPKYVEICSCGTHNGPPPPDLYDSDECVPSWSVRK